MQNHGGVFRHGRSIRTFDSSSQMPSGRVNGRAVFASDACKLLKELVGASGFEPPASWSRTRRSSQAEPRPEQIQFRLLQHPIATVWNVVPLSFGIAAAIRKDSRGHSVAASKGVTGWPPACK